MLLKASALTAASVALAASALWWRRGNRICRDWQRRRDAAITVAIERGDFAEADRLRSLPDTTRNGAHLDQLLPRSTPPMP